MNKWRTRDMTRACLFGALLALLMGCDNESSAPFAEQDKPAGTFVTDNDVDKGKGVDDTKVPAEPVVADIKVLPETKPKPVTSDPHSPEQTIITPGEMEPYQLPVVSDPHGPTQTTITQGQVETYEPPTKRFIEIAPDASEGAAFQSSPPIEILSMGQLVAEKSEKDGPYTDGDLLVTPMKGLLRHPTTLDNATNAKRYPVVILLHGNHDENDPSYQGYDYIAQPLAQHGYVVLSLDANAINPDDWSSQARGQLILGTLDRLRQIDENGQVDKNGKAGPLEKLKGKLDFSRIGNHGAFARRSRRLQRNAVQPQSPRRNRGRAQGRPSEIAGCVWCKSSTSSHVHRHRQDEKTFH